MATKKVITPKSARELPSAIIKQMIILSTSGFGLVAALAWNEVVKSGIEIYVKPYLPQDSQFLSHLIYATTVTILAVVITLQLTRLEQRFLTKKEKPN